LNAVLQTKQFPASITDLAARLTNVQIDNFTHDYDKERLIGATLVR